MEIFRNPIIVKTIFFITCILFFIASLSPDFMSTMLGVDMGPFASLGGYQGCFGGVGGAIGQNKEVGIIVMLAVLMLLLVSYFIAHIFKSIYSKLNQ